MMRTPACTASDLATSDPEGLSVETEVNTALDWLDANDYDIAPVFENGSPTGYVDRADLSGDSVTGPVEAHTNQITLQKTISPTASFDAVIDALYEEPVYFLGGQDELTGILTRADLNSPPARNHLFTRLLGLEEAFRRLIETEVPNWEDTPGLSPEIVDDIKDRYQQARGANVELSKLHYAQFSTLTDIIETYPSCWEACGYEADHRARTRLSKLTDLRNDVAHATPIIQNTDRGFGESGRTITDLIELSEELSRLTECLGTATT
jgi:hypothetical protein